MIAVHDFCISLGFIFECDHGSLGGFTFSRMDEFPHFTALRAYDQNTKHEAALIP
jgi:hypothetical protein